MRKDVKYVSLQESVFEPVFSAVQSVFELLVLAHFKGFLWSFSRSHCFHTVKRFYSRLSFAGSLHFQKVVSLLSSLFLTFRCFVRRSVYFAVGISSDTTHLGVRVFALPEVVSVSDFETETQRIFMLKLCFKTF